MPAQHPGVAEPADGVLRRLGHEVRVGQPVARVDQELPDLVGPEARQVEVEAKISQVAQFDAQQLLVPPRVEGEPVVGEDIRALLRLGEMRQLDHRHLGHAELARGQQPAVPGDDAALAIHQNGVGEAELTDRGGYLRHLHVAVGAGVARVGHQRVDARGVVGRKHGLCATLAHPALPSISRVGEGDVVSSGNGVKRLITTCTGASPAGGPDSSTWCFSRQPAPAFSQKIVAAMFPGVVACWQRHCATRAVASTVPASSSCRDVLRSVGGLQRTTRATSSCGTPKQAIAFTRRRCSSAGTKGLAGIPASLRRSAPAHARRDARRIPRAESRAQYDAVAMLCAPLR
jgi:hypothetical protein